MNDCFAQLDLPRRPWLESEMVKKAFLKLAADCHPDRFQQSAVSEREAAHQRYTDLNEANACLTNPQSRLRHFLELERGGRLNDLREIPDDLMTLFSEIAQAIRSVDDFLKKRSLATSPLMKAMLMEEGGTHQPELDRLSKTLQQRTEVLEETMKRIDAALEANSVSNATSRDELLSELESVHRLASFQDRWLAQLREKSMALIGYTLSVHK